MQSRVQKDLDAENEIDRFHKVRRRPRWRPASVAASVVAARTPIPTTAARIGYRCAYCRCAGGSKAIPFAAPSLLGAPAEYDAPAVPRRRSAVPNRVYAEFESAEQYHEYMRPLLLEEFLGELSHAKYASASVHVVSDNFGRFVARCRAAVVRADEPP